MTQADLAEAAGVTLAIVKNYERGSLDPRASTLAAIERALTERGIIFLDADDVRPGGRGVRFQPGREPDDE